jgi:hypothetical protein
MKNEMSHPKKTTTHRLTLCSILTFSLAFPGLSWGATYNVSPTVDTDCSDGACDFQSALTAAQANNGINNTIRLAQGTYTGNFTYIPTGANTGGLEILGGWSANFSSRDLDPNNTVIDGNQTGTTLTLKVNFDDLNIIAGDLKVEGATIKNGTGDYGGGLVALTAAPSRIDINKCIIENNHANASDGGCTVGTFDFNTQTTDGELHMTNNIIRNNEVSGGTGDFIHDGNGAGCAIFVNGLAVVSNNLVYGNSVASDTYDHPYGGGLDMTMLAGDLYFVNNTVTANTVVTNPVTDGTGSGIVVATNIEDHEFTPWAPVHAYLDNNIVNNNTESASPGDDIASNIRSAGAYTGSTITISYSNYNDLWAAPGSVDPTLAGNITSDPQLSTFPTTLYALSSSSPCIDTGLNTATHLPEKDLLGNSRKWDGNTDGTAVVDMGCYEYGSQQAGKSNFSWNLFLPAITTKKQ